MESAYGRCKQCDVKLTALEMNCPSCHSHVGFPNVVLAEIAEEVARLNERFISCQNDARISNLTKPFEELQQAIETEAKIVVAMPVTVALSILANPKSQYVGYEKLVGAGARQTASFENDAHRKVVAGALFGTFGENIIYGVLSLSGRGISSYGDIFCTLRTKMVQERTSFLESNSYDFVEQHGTNTLPKGYRASWSAKSKLVAVKFQEAKLLNESQSLSDWELLLVKSKSKSRDQDEFIEAHIYGTFNSESIESMQTSTHIAKRDIRLADDLIERFSRG